MPQSSIDVQTIVGITICIQNRKIEWKEVEDPYEDPIARFNLAEDAVNERMDELSSRKSSLR